MGSKKPQLCLGQQLQTRAAKNLAVGLLVATLTAATAGAHAVDEPKGAAPSVSATDVCQIASEGQNEDKKKRRIPKSDQSVTQHRLSIRGKSIDYIATAGTIVIRDDEDKPIAEMSYVAYTKSGVKDTRQRPVMFAFNGGPGWSSLWLHMGVLGPKRVVVSDLDPTPSAPYRTVENEFGVLDKSDLVMIDPVSTGLSRAVCDKHDDEFWGVDADVDSMSRFIAQYVSDNNRWTSPKYLLGESYGTTRAAAMTNHLRTRWSLALNGLILVSAATDVEAIFAQLPGNDRPYALYLPAYAAAGWYHHVLPGRPAALEPFLEEVRRYAAGPFTAALFKGDALEDAERDAVAEQVHKYTGLSVEYLKAANLRVSERAFTHELLKAQRKTIGRLDARFVGSMKDPLEKFADYDPSSTAVSAAFTAAFLDYYHGDLKFGQGRTYRPVNSDLKWKWAHRPFGEREQPIVNSGVDLAQALVQDANLHVMVLAGYFDLATPFSAAEYMMSHMRVPRSASSRIRIRYYESGHLMYVHPPSLKKMKSDLDSFIDLTTHP